ncbi:MAG: ricin-type beta-trefoil lectin domain protein [Saprospiraceae bacterium]|nr:ricin-type beta-trefoil lectin domain protein [Saprospiraceae bacterium]
MKTSNNNTCFFFKRLTGLIFLLATMPLSAQTTLGLSGTVSANDGSYQDFKIPTSMAGKSLYLTLRGSDGGRGIGSVHKAAGQGSTVVLVSKIGTGAHSIPAGSTLRFIVGKRGRDASIAAVSLNNAVGTGGGGTAVAFKGPAAGDKWVLLAVAGGGSGSNANSTGGGTIGKPGEGIAYARASASTGTGGKADDGFHCSDVPSPGGGAFSSGETAVIKEMGCDVTRYGGEAAWPGGPDSGEPTGGSGREGGGWGFGGGGGNAEKTVSHGSSGGGGGYTGGNTSSASETGYGGTSFLNSMYAIGNYTNNGTSKASADGSVKFLVQDDFYVGFTAINYAVKTGKCLNAVVSDASLNGTAIQLQDCETDNYDQMWERENNQLLFAAVRNKCLDLENSITANGAKIQLYDCNGTKAQKWLYDGINKSLHSRESLSYCLDLNKGNTANGTAIQLWQCNGRASQQWQLGGIETVATDQLYNRIHLVGGTSKCMDVKAAETTNSTNIQVYQCHHAESQYWYFENNAIKFSKDSTKCLDLSNSSTANGANIQLYSCNGTDAQKWLYDSNARAFRSWKNPDKCIDVDHSNFTDGTNIQLWDCNGSTAQQFTIEAVPTAPCINDKTPPVAKCKDFTNTANIIPTAAIIDNGSYDNCSVSSMHLESTGFNKYKLTVTDPSGNSSSCTATVN